ncbi:GGDEF domain-containing protein [Oricola sp.]|uniref:GGDEF domain-containing protein n=1 Tax=Oricola sp. TaxID=1979950 RepID=UPI003514E17B
MVLALSPILLSAGVGFVLLDRGVIAPIHDIAFRQRQQIEPVQKLRVLVWDTLIPVDEYVEDGNPLHVDGYRKLRADIESELAGLRQSLGDVPSAQALIERAQQSWSDADRVATSLMASKSEGGSATTVAALGRFHASIMSTSDRLQAAYRQLAERIDRDHDAAVLSYERSIWIAGIAAGTSLLAVVGGVVMIGRVLTGSVDRLVEGAARFAEGERNHRIHVAVPPELNRVAEEFNYMIGRIEESEKTLAELAHVDSLTGVSNRRAFDTAFTEVLSQHVRTGLPASLLAIDLDHFKRINDTWGHSAGDEVLRAATKVMTENMRPSDRLFRMGGEEFCVLMSMASLQEASEMAERHRSALATTVVRFKETDIHFTASFGVAELGDRIELEDVLAAADAALYQAKSRGRNRVVVDGFDANELRNTA